MLTLLLLELFSLGAAKIFNAAMEEQQMFRGTITVDRLISDLTGHVYFTGLTWKDLHGETIVYIPSGNFRVRIWDVITHNYKSTTIQELTINNAIISLHVDDKGRLDFIKPTSPKDNPEDEEDSYRNIKLEGLSEEERKWIGMKHRQKRELSMQKKWQNFNREGKRIKARLILNNTRMEIFYRNMQYRMNHVHIVSTINTEKDMTLNASIGGFGGTMVGDGISVHGKILFEEKSEPELDLALAFYAVQPSSLGIGMNVKERMSLETYFTGPISNPIGSGTVAMDELNIPALHFEKIQGDITYKNGNLTFDDVYAKVFDGDFHANGDYNFDTRYYHIYGIGTNLQASKALPGSGLDCPVNLELSFTSNGSPRAIEIDGTFKSGEGMYRHVPFYSIAGRVNSTYRDLKFSDVRIMFHGFTLETDAFRIKDGKLTMDPVQVYDAKGNFLTNYIHQ